MSVTSKTLEFVLTFDTSSELSQTVENDLIRGRALIPEDRELPTRQRCRLRLVHPELDVSHEIEAEAVWSNPDGAGVGLEFVDWDDRRVAGLLRFVSGVVPGRTTDLAAANDGSIIGGPDPEAVLDEDIDDFELGHSFQNLTAPSTSEADELDDSDEAQLDDDDDGTVTIDGRTRRQNIFERIRRLKHHEQQQLARQGSHAERIALERCFGGAVWEPLLQNPQLSGPEVANIAKKGSLPRPALAMIVAHGGWVSIPEVQRALLSNPRLDPAGVTKVLRMMPRHELAKIPQQPRFSTRIRAEAKKLLQR